jgi:hypothetical protein
MQLREGTAVTGDDDTESKPGENQGQVLSDWISAPGDSHVDAFRLIDNSASEFGASSHILVRFKGSRGGTPATYRYTFSKHYAAKATFEALSGSAHPGEVVHSELKAKNVPYFRVS